MQLNKNERNDAEGAAHIMRTLVEACNVMLKA
jgi:hypothetical protein